MKLISTVLTLCCFFLFLPLAHAQSELFIELSPHTESLRGQMTFSGKAGEYQFTLNRGLRVTNNKMNGQITLLQKSTATTHNYRYTNPNPQWTETIEFAGSPLAGPEYPPKILSPLGVALFPDLAWYPQFVASPEQLNFRVAKLSVQLPQGWHSLSQGKRANSPSTTEVWQDLLDQEGLYLLANQWEIFQNEQDGIQAMVLLMPEQNNAQMAARYLDLTHTYIAQYNKMLGPYPYAKFATVENFWETGYGMPSFTLLGQQVLRLPFLGQTSFPHEILHNWWGNGVFVDYEKGNWCEGLTSYLADHQIQREAGKDAEYRRQALQRFTQYVNEQNDFPLLQFRQRFDKPSMAIGYDKSLMLFHMLKNKIGEPQFFATLQKIYQKYLHQSLGYMDFVSEFIMHDPNLNLFFRSWLQLTDAPFLSIQNAAVQLPTQQSLSPSPYKLHLTLKQSTQHSSPLPLPIPIRIQTTAEVLHRQIWMIQNHQDFQIPLQHRPISLSVDPEFEVMRRLHLQEMPATLSDSYAGQFTLLLPATMSARESNRYQQMIELWQRDYQLHVDLKRDTDLDQLDPQKNYWLVGGQENRWFAQTLPQLKAQDGELSDTALKLSKKEFSLQEHAFVVTVRQTDSHQSTLTLLHIPELIQLDRLERSLPHYGKESYVIFKDSKKIEAANWSVKNSPLQKSL